MGFCLHKMLVISLVFLTSTLLIGCQTNSSKSSAIFDNGRSEPDPKLRLQLPDGYMEIYHSRSDRFRIGRFSYSVGGSPSPIEFKIIKETNSRLDEVMATSSSFSYLFYDNGKVVYDELPPEGRFNKTFNNNTYFPSHSMGKSITSYMIGHAICEGYIDTIDTPLDFPLMENTLYFEQPIINLLNMASGDRHLIGHNGRFINSGRHYHGRFPIRSAVQKELKDSKPIKQIGSNPHYYSNYTSDILYSYLMYKVGADKWDQFLEEFFQDHIGVKNPIYWEYNPTTSNYNVNLKTMIEDGVGRYGLYATRYDFLRIAKSIMNNWQQDTCEGRYLKSIYDRRINRGKNTYLTSFSWTSAGQPTIWGNSEEYAGQFYTTMNGLEDRMIFGMDGAHGQQIMIDFENSRIAVISSQQERYVNGRVLMYEPIKYGRIQ